MPRPGANRLGHQFANHWGEFEAVSTSPRRHHQPLHIWVAIDEEIPIGGVGVETKPGLGDGSVGQTRQVLRDRKSSQPGILGNGLPNPRR